MIWSYSVSRTIVVYILFVMMWLFLLLWLWWVLYAQVIVNSGDYSISIPGYVQPTSTNNTLSTPAPVMSVPVSTGVATSTTNVVPSLPQVIYEVIPNQMAISSGLKTRVLTPWLDEYAESFAWMSKLWITSNKTLSEYNGSALVPYWVAVRFMIQFIRSVWLETQYIVMEDRTCQYSDIGSLSPAVQQDIIRACQRGIVSDEDVFSPTRLYTRAEFVGLMLDSVMRMSASSAMPRSQQFNLIKEREVTKSMNDSSFKASLSRKEIALYLFRLRGALLYRWLPWLIGLPEAPVRPDAWWLVSLDPAQQPEFIEARYWAQDEQMIDNALSLSSINPYRTLTRGELAEIVAGYVLYAGVQPTYSDVNGCVFNDINRESESRRDAIELVCRAWYMGTNSQTFRPQDSVQSYVMYVVLMRMIEWRQPENTTPRWKNYIKKAQSYGMTDGLVVEDRLATMYEVLMTLYQYDMSKILLEQMNSDNLTNQLISTIQTNTWGKSALISLDMSLLGDSQFEQWFAEVMGKTYEVKQQAVKRYYAQAFVWYGTLNNLDSGKKIWSVVFVVAQWRLVRGTMRIGWVSYSVNRDDNGSGLYRLQSK